MAERTGISESQARTAVGTVVGLLKERPPAPVAGQVDGALAGSAGVVGGIADRAGEMLGGIFGGNKE